MIDLRVVSESSLPDPLVVSLTEMLRDLVREGAALGLEKMAVAPSFARQGLGRRLLRHLTEHARAAKVEQLTLDF